MTRTSQNRRKKTEALSVYEYNNFRTYLKDFYALRKTSNRGYSYRQFSKEAGFGSPNILKLVIEGNRNIGSQDSLEKFTRALGLGAKMSKYFKALVHWNQEKSIEGKAELFKKLRALSPLANVRSLDDASVTYLSNWLCPIILEMTQIPGFRDDPYWISRRVVGRATLEQIASAVGFLKENEFIKKAKDGTWVAEANMVLSSDEVKSMAIQTYHKNMLAQAQQMLEDLPLDEREYGALTFVLPESSVSELKQKLKAIRQELHLWSTQQMEQNVADTVVQLNLQMYKHTKKVV